MSSSAPIRPQPLGARLPRDPRNGTVRRPPAMQTLLYLGVQSVPPGLQDPQPDLRKRAGYLGYSRPARTDRIANHLNLAESCAPPSGDCFLPPLPEPSLDQQLQSSASSAPAGVTVHSDAGRLRPAGRCHPSHSPVPPSGPVSTRLTRRRCPLRDPTGLLTPLFLPCFSKSTVPSLNTPTGTPGPSIRLS